MADSVTGEQTTPQVNPESTAEAQMNEPIPTPNDPGDAQRKGFSADGRPAPVPDDGPVPLAPGPDHHPAFHQPELEGKVEPTGRSGVGGSQGPAAGKDYPPATNDRLKGADH